MPCHLPTPDCPYNEIKLKFAWLPLNDMDGETLWLRPYWEYGDWCSIGFYVIRGRKKEYPTKDAFWNNIKFRITALY